jgi:hypothetical protein
MSVAPLCTPVKPKPFPIRRFVFFQCLDNGITPIKSSMLLQIIRAVDKRHQVQILLLDESSLNALDNLLPQRLVIVEDVDQEYRCGKSVPPQTIVSPTHV